MAAEINGNLHVNTLEAWQGSFGTGTGYMATPRRRKEEEEKEKPGENDPPTKEEGVTKDDTGIVHVDLIA